MKAHTDTNTLVIWSGKVCKLSKLSLLFFFHLIGFYNYFTTWGQSELTASLLFCYLLYCSLIKNKHAQSSAVIINIFLTFTEPQQNWQDDKLQNHSLNLYVFIQVLLQSSGQECVWFGTSQRNTHLCH